MIAVDVRSYGAHSPLGRTLDVPEEKDPPEGYVGLHSPDHPDIRGCNLSPDECVYRCRRCGHHMCLCFPKE